MDHSHNCTYGACDYASVNNVKMTGRAFEFPGEAMSILLYFAVILIAAFRNPDPN
jgi:hypothetical protein